jgi:hypothetical protein
MQEREWTTIDKSEWGEGMWKDEPDKVQFEAHGLPCLLHRGPGGHWCGYVGVAEGHPCFEQEYDRADVDVHGGLTFASFCSDTDDESKGICHLPDEGENHRVWWLGFDCAHAGDFSPKYNRYGYPVEMLMDSRGEVYRDIRYARAETERLAQQLATA